MKLNQMIPLCPRRCGVIAAMILAVLTFTTNSQAMEVLLAESTFDGGGADFDGWTAFECTNPGICPLTGEVGELLPGPPPPTPGSKFFHNDGVVPPGVPGSEGSPFGPAPGGGNLEIVDPSGISTGLFKAPGKFTSVLEPGLWFSFDLKINGLAFDNDDPGLFMDLVPLFYIASTGGVIVYALHEDLVSPTLNLWTEWDFLLVPNGDPGAGPGAWFTIAGLDDGTGFGAVFGGTAFDLRIWGELTIDDPEADGGQLDNVQLISHVVPIPAALFLMVPALAGLGFAARRRG